MVGSECGWGGGGGGERQARSEENHLFIVGHVRRDSFEQLRSLAASSTYGLGEATLCCIAGYPIV